MIPAEESVQLAQALERKGLDVHLNVSPLIGHGVRQLLWKDRDAVIQVLETFGHFASAAVRSTPFFSPLRDSGVPPELLSRAQPRHPAGGL
ncbi:MAG: hypothetical protein AAF654_07655 [Myxococcota bacterium]